MGRTRCRPRMWPRVRFPHEEGLLYKFDIMWDLRRYFEEHPQVLGRSLNICRFGLPGKTCQLSRILAVHSSVEDFV